MTNIIYGIFICFNRATVENQLASYVIYGRCWFSRGFFFSIHLICGHTYKHPIHNSHTYNNDKCDEIFLESKEKKRTTRWTKWSKLFFCYVCAFFYRSQWKMMFCSSEIGKKQRKKNRTPCSQLNIFSWNDKRKISTWLNVKNNLQSLLWKLFGKFMEKSNQTSIYSKWLGIRHRITL